MAKYPFPSRQTVELKDLRDGQDYATWTAQGFGLEAALQKLHGGILEIGGPTDGGFYFLDGVELPSEVLITNKSKIPFAFHPEAEMMSGLVAKVVDGRHLPDADGTLAMVLMGAMSIADDKDDEKGVPQAPDEDYDHARFEFEQVALGIVPADKVVDAQRVHIYQEVWRVLEPGGLFMSDGEIAEIVVLQQLGFELVASLQVCVPQVNVLTYEYIVRKPGS